MLYHPFYTGYDLYSGLNPSKNSQSKPAFALIRMDRSCERLLDYRLKCAYLRLNKHTYTLEQNTGNVSYKY